MANGKGDSSRPAWTWQQDKAFEVALTKFPEGSENRWENIAANIPGNVTPEEAKHHYDLLVADIAAIEAGNVTLPDYKTVASENEGSEVVEQQDDKNALWETRKGVAWSEAEHARFLLGIKRYGKGDWKSIAKDFVKTRSSTQVASHAQKHYKKLEAGRKNDGKRWSIFDITSDDVTDEELKKLGEEDGVVIDEQREQVTGLNQQVQQASFDVNQQASFDVNQQEGVQGRAVHGRMLGVKEVVEWGIWSGCRPIEVVQALWANFSTSGTNGAVQTSGINPMPPFRTNAAAQAFGIIGALPRFGVNRAQPTFGVNGPLPPFGVHGPQPPFGVNGHQPPFGFNGPQPPFGVNRAWARPPFGVNVGNVVPQSQPRSTPHISPPASWYVGSDDDDDDGSGSGSGDAGHQSQQPPK